MTPKTIISPHFSFENSPKWAWIGTQMKLVLDVYHWNLHIFKTTQQILHDGADDNQVFFVGCGPNAHNKSKIKNWQITLYLSKRLIGTNQKNLHDADWLSEAHRPLKFTFKFTEIKEVQEILAQQN